MLGKSIYQSVLRVYTIKPAENPDDNHALILAPAGMFGYHVNGNTIHSGLHIDFKNQSLVLWKNVKGTPYSQSKEKQRQ